MNNQPDQQLLRAYAAHRSEAAFAELVRRHIDLVHSAAVRMVCDAHLAQDVTQGVFVALARHAAQLADRPVLSGWLHRTARNLASKTVRTDVRRRVREQEAVVMNELLSATPEASWEQIAPHLDAALGELSESERDAVLLRYFEKKSAPDMAGHLGISPEAAQKRVSRAVERLRECFVKRGISVGASGLVVVISANAVQATPAGLAVAISTTAALGASAVATTITKALAMTTLQKTIIAATLTTAVGFGFYETRQNSLLRAQIHQQKQQQTATQAEFQRAETDASVQLATLREENQRLQQNTADLSRLRAEIGRLRAATQTAALSPNPIPSSTPPEQAVEFPSATWNDIGFATPHATLQTRGWSVLNGNRERFKDSIFITPDARKTLEDMFMQMAEASTDPNKARYLEEILQNQFGVEEGILMPLMAEHQQRGYTGYRILSETAPDAEQVILELETQMTSGPVKREKLKLQRFAGDWKVVIDQDFIKMAR